VRLASRYLRSVNLPPERAVPRGRMPGDTVTPVRTATNTAGPAIKVGSHPFFAAITP
jgi:hypothetical protein